MPDTKPMLYSKTGLALTQRFEGCRLQAYQDTVGVWTIGYGHTGADVVPGLTWTQEQADSQLQADTQHAVNCVNALVKVKLTQPEFGALVDFVFNIGCYAFARSTMLKLLNAGKFSEAEDEFVRWDKAGGVEVAGLLRRREAEKSEFDGNA